MITAHKLGFAFGQVERGAVGLCEGAHKEDQESQRLVKYIPVDPLLLCHDLAAC